MRCVRGIECYYRKVADNFEVIGAGEEVLAGRGK